MKPLTIYDMIILQDFFDKRKDPTERDKAAAEKIHHHLLLIAESLLRTGPIPE